MRYFILIFLFLFLAGTPASLPASAWETANAAFAAGDYPKAVQYYQETIKHHGPAAARLFNLGNAHAKLQQFGPAILAYERAALLAPRDADVLANLRLTREAARSANPAAPFDTTSPPPWWQAPLHWLSLHEWSWLTALGTGIITLLVIAKTCLRVPPAWLPHAQPILCVLGLATAIPGSLALIQRRQETRIAIIIAEKPILRLSPFPEANAVGTPAPGQHVLPLGTRDGWCYLAVSGTSLRGWLPKSDIEALLP